jgi:hypothetical protein
MTIFSPFSSLEFVRSNRCYIFAGAARIDPQYLETETRKSASERLKGMPVGYSMYTSLIDSAVTLRPIG